MEKQKVIGDVIREIKKAFFSIFPIYFLVMALHLMGVIRLSGGDIFSFSVSSVLVIAGIGLFSYGADNAMTPIGKMIGKGVTRQGKIGLLLLLVFVFGFLITVSEPDLAVLSSQTESVFPKFLTIFSISIAVGFFLILAVERIIGKINLPNMLSVIYMFIFSMTSLLVYKGKGSMLGLCFDSGGVTTGPMTVPFIMALGVGIAAVLAKKSEKDASFGFIAFSSAGPVAVMLILCFFSKGNMEYHVDMEYEGISYFSTLLPCIIHQMKGVGVSIGLILVCYAVMDRLFIHSDLKKILKFSAGLLFVYAGLVMFLSAAEAAYIKMGYIIGSQLASQNEIAIACIAFAIGAMTVLAEPAIKVLTEQVEEITNGLVRRKSLLVALAFGSGAAISMALIRICRGFSILYVLVLGYALCFVLSFFVPKIYTAIAFDAGGVASGPMTSSFVLPVAIGLCFSMRGEENVLLYGFGVVALVALSPLISIEMLGFVMLVRNRIRVNREVNRVLRKDDRMIISFSDDRERGALETLFLMVIALPKGKREVFADLLVKYNVNIVCSTLARGSYDSQLTKELIFCVIRSDMVKDAILAVEDKFSDLKSRISMVYTIPVDSVIGIADYLALAGGGKK